MNLSQTETLTTETEESRQLRVRRIHLTRIIKDTLFISLGVLSATFGLKGFLLPDGFLDGGAVGISLLINVVTGFDLSYLIIIINIPFIIIGYSTSISSSRCPCLPYPLLPFNTVTPRPILWMIASLMRSLLRETMVTLVYSSIP